jgi:hypothetical protein
MAKAGCSRPVAAEVLFGSQFSYRGIYGGQSGAATSFWPSTSVYPRHCHSTSASIPYNLRLVLHEGGFTWFTVDDALNVNSAFIKNDHSRRRLKEVGCGFGSIWINYPG